MESLMANFVQFSCLIAEFLFMERTLDTKFKFWDFPEIILFFKILSLKSFARQVRQFTHSTSGGNNSAPFHLWWIEAMLKHKKSLRYSVRDCLQYFPLLSISLRIQKHSKGFLVLQEKH